MPEGLLTLHGDLGIQVIRRDVWVLDKIKSFNPKSELGLYIKSVLHYLPMNEAIELIDRISRTVVFESALSIIHRRPGKKDDNYGVVSNRVVTTAGVNFLVDAWENGVEMEIMKYHGCGTGTNAEANGDTALQTECTTVLNPDSTRPTGSLADGGSANVLVTVGTPVFDGSAAVTEHGLFSQAATGGGTLWDRSVFSAINVAALDSIQFTYSLTANAGG